MRGTPRSEPAGPAAARRAAAEPFLRVVRALAEAYQAFERVDAAGLREHGLTTAQADVLFTLGNTEGMSCKELGARTLITKGTLTGVLDRMEGKGWLRRRPSLEDGRSFVVALTARGDRLFQTVFPRQIEYLKRRFRGLGRGELERMTRMLSRLRDRF